MKRIILLILTICLLALPAWAQPKVSKTVFSAQESISHNKVTGMVVDSRGLLWISTWGGLYRYDGYHFTSFPIEPGDGSELANARLDDIIENEQGQLVCSSYDKNYIFNYDTIVVAGILIRTSEFDV